MITLASHSDLNDIAQLWKIVFGDTQSFVDFVTTELISPHNTFIDKQNNSLTGMTIIFPANLYRQKKIYRVYYIYGVGVHPQYRNQKIAAKLLQHIVCYAQNNNIDGLILMPATESLFSYYEKQNFQTAFSLQKINFQRENTLLLKNYEQQTVSIPIITKLRNQFLKNFSNMAVSWSETQMQQRYKAALLNEEEWFVIQSKGDVIYIMVEKKSSKHLLVKECTCMDKDFETANQFLFSQFPLVENIEYLIHPALHQNGQIVNNGMLLPLSSLLQNSTTGYLNLCLD